MENERKFSAILFVLHFVRAVKPNEDEKQQKRRKIVNVITVSWNPLMQRMVKILLLVD